MNIHPTLLLQQLTGLATASLALLSAGPTVLLAQQPPDTASHRGLTNNEFMRTWLVLGPIPISDEPQKPPEDEAQKKAFATDFLSQHGGEAGVQPKPGLAQQIAGKDYQWRLVQSKTDTVDLIRTDAPKEFVAAYAWAEMDLSEAATALFGLASDDAVRVWLNGKLIHENWIPRPVRHDDDLVEFRLQKGRNQLLLKVQNMQGDWGFACRRLGADVLAGKLASAAAKGDLDAVQLLLSRGVDVNAKNQQGLTPWRAAKTHGYMEVSDVLQSKGADPTAAMPPAEDQIDALFKDLTKGESSGAAVLAARDGRILFKKGYGYANLEHRVPVIPETKFRIGSVTKQFTAAAVFSRSSPAGQNLRYSPNQRPSSFGKWSRPKSPS
ncbi:MAG: serine hydrolase [Chloroflexi bacterium]|nr:serine hydrolase [Chloroflexota bacterium]